MPHQASKKNTAERGSNMPVQPNDYCANTVYWSGQEATLTLILRHVSDRSTSTIGTGKQTPASRSIWTLLNY